MKWLINMPRPLKVFLLIVLVLLIFSLGKWLILDSLLQDQKSGRYRSTTGSVEMSQGSSK